jgi:ATP-binding cassette, subfamily B, bacterial
MSRPYAPTSRDPTLAAKLHHYLAGYRRRLGMMAVVSVAGAVFEAASLAALVPLVAAIASPEKRFVVNLGRGLGERTFGVEQLFLICFVAVVGRAGIQFTAAWLDARTSGRYASNTRRRLIGDFLAASWTRQSEERLGHLQLLLTENVSHGLTCLRSVVQMLVSGCNFLVLLLTSLWVDSTAAVMLLAAAAVLFLVVRPLSSFARTHGKEKTSLNTSFSTAVNQAVGLAREVRIYGAVAQVRDSLNRTIDRLQQSRDSHLLASASLPVIYQNTAALIVLAGLAWVYFGSSAGLAGLATSAILLVRAFSYTQNLQVAYHHVVEALPYLDQLEEASARYRETAPHSGEERIATIDRLEFDDVSFAYPDGVQAISNVSFFVEQGDAVGVVGPSGSGKSTLIQLLLRLRSPDSGALLINGRPAESAAHECWFHRIGFVPQEPILLDDSIEENIRFYRDITPEAVRNAARMAGIHDEIEAMAAGYQTQAGERGASLSGGQRQRICIARALAGGPQVIVFDEPTSALDVHSEACIQASLRQVKGSVTLIIVAHRLSTLNICDKVMILRDGRMQSFGPPKELAQTDAYYSEALRLARVE